MKRFFNYTARNKVSLLKSAGIIVIIFYYTVLSVYSQNIPYWDDYVVTLQFFNNFFDSNTFFGKVNALLDQWSEHRIVIGRILSLIQFYACGVLNFKILHIISNLAISGLFFLLLKSAQSDLRQWLFLPVALLLFQFQYYVASFWFVSSSSMFFVLMFGFLSLHYLKKENYWCCAFFAAVGVFSNGNGFLILPVEIIYLLIIKKYKISFAFILFFLSLMAIYFHGYFPHENDRMATLYFLKDPVSTVLYFLNFLGGCFNLGKVTAPFFGLFSLVFISWLTWKKYYLLNSTVYLMILIIAGSAFMAAIGRSFWGVEQALESRYKIFSIVLWICILIAFLENQSEIIRKSIYPYLIGAGLIFNIGANYKSWPFMLRFLNAQIHDYAEVKKGTPRLNLNEAHDILVESQSKGYY